MFPFKFELKNALYDYHTKGGLEIFNNHSISTIQNELLSFYMMFLSYNNRSAVFDYVDSIHKNYYHINITKETDDYIKYLPKVMYTITEYEQTEIKILEMQGYSIISELKFEETLAHMVSFIKKNYKKHQHAILPWVNNLEKYKFYLGIISSRSYGKTLSNWEKLHGYQVTSKPMGHVHKELIKTLTENEDLSGVVLYPFIDNCNHKSTSLTPGKETFNFHTISKYDQIWINTNNPTKQGEEFSYTYSPNLSSEKFVFSYGFFLKNNPNAGEYIDLKLRKSDFSVRKNEICKYVSCFDQSIDELYSNNNNVDKFILKIKIGKYDILKRVVDALRLHALPEARLDDNIANIEDIVQRLGNNRWLDYYTEMKAFAFFRDSVFDSLNKTKLSYEQLIFSSAETKKYFLENKEVSSNPEMRYKFILRSNIIDLSKESKSVLYYNALNAQKEIRKVLSDQFKKLRNYYS